MKFTCETCQKDFELPDATLAGGSGAISCTSCGSEVSRYARQQTTAVGPELRDFDIERVLGEGGMATVYLARPKRGGESVALKLTHPHMASDPDLLQRFLQEIKAAAAMNHPNIMRVISYGEDAGRWYIACELADAGTVDDLLVTLGRLPAQLVAVIGWQMLSALHYAHERGIIHRDIKPANLLLQKTGVLKLADFGIAKSTKGASLTQTGALVGTPAYMSPEQASGQKGVDARSDLFSAGVVLYELLSGANPFVAEQFSITLLQIIQGPPTSLYAVAPVAPPELEALVDRLMEKEPTRRFASAVDALGALQGYVEQITAAYPDLLQRFIADPKGTAAELDRHQASAYFDEAMAIGTDPARRSQVALLLHRVLLLDPNHAEAGAAQAALCAEAKFSFGPATNAKIGELESALESSNDLPGSLQRLAQLYKLEGNIGKTVACFKRYLRLRPDDAYVRSQLAALTGERLATVVGGPHSVDSGPRALPGLASGIRPGGFAGQKAGGTAVQAQVALGTTRPASALKEGAGDDDSMLRDLLEAHGRKMVGIAVALGALVLVFKLVGRGVESSSEEMAQRMEKRAMKAAAEKAQEEAALVQRIKDAAKPPPAKEEPGPGAKLDAGNRLLRDGKHSAAVEVFSGIISQQPASPDLLEALVRRGQAYQRMDHHPEALADFNGVLSRHSTGSLANECRLARAEVYKRMGDPVSSRADLHAVLASTAAGDPLRRSAEEALGIPSAPAPPPAPPDGAPAPAVPPPPPVVDGAAAAPPPVDAAPATD